MSDTPRTDSRSGWSITIDRISKSDVLFNDPVGPFVHSHFARELERENASLREELHNANCEIDMWASRCAAAIWMLPEQVTGGQLREAQDKFHRMLHAARKEAQP